MAEDEQKEALKETLNNYGTDLNFVLISMRQLQANNPPIIGRHLSIAVTELENTILRLGAGVKELN